MTSRSDSGQGSTTGGRVLYGFWLSPYMSLVAHVMGEAGLDYRYERVSPFLGATQSPEHKARNALGKVPSLREPDGLVISESQAICRYLARTYPAAQRFYPCQDARRCAEVDRVNDFLTFSISGPFFNWFVVGAYYPKAFRLKVEAEANTFSQWSAVVVRGAMARLLADARLAPFLLGAEPCLPDFHLFHILTLGKTFARLFELPAIDLCAGDPRLPAYYAAMAARPSSGQILAAQAAELVQTERELFEEFGKAYAPMLQASAPALQALFGHEV